MPSIPEQGLQERNFGTWDSWEWPRISIELNKLSLEARYTFKPPGGESWHDMEVRLEATLRDIAKLDHDSVAVMTHAGPIRVLLAMLDVKTKAATIKFIPTIGKTIVIEFDPSAL